MSFLIHKARMPYFSKNMPSMYNPGLILALYCVRHPHAMPCLKNNIPYSVLKPFTAFLLDFLVLFSCNARIHLFSRRINIHTFDFHEHEEYFWCSILHTLCSIVTEIRFQMNICSLLHKLIN